MKIFAEGHIEDVYEEWLSLILHFAEDNDTYAVEVMKADFPKDEQQYLVPGQPVRFIGENYDEAKLELALSFWTQEELDAAKERAEQFAEDLGWMVAA